MREFQLPSDVVLTLAWICTSTSPDLSLRDISFHFSRAERLGKSCSGSALHEESDEINLQAFSGFSELEPSAHTSFSIRL